MRIRAGAPSIRSLVWAALIASSAPAALFAQELPHRMPIGHLETVASIDAAEPAGVAVSSDGRILVTLPRHDAELPFTVGELHAGRLRPYPDPEMNRPTPERASSSLFSVQNAVLDAGNHLQLLDSGFLEEGSPPVPGAPKLVEVNLTTNRPSRTLVLPPEALAAKSELKDVRIDSRRGPGGTAFITDSAPGEEAFIIVDLASGRAFRRLQGHRSTKPGVGVVPIVGGVALMQRPAGGGPSKPFAVGLNGLALSPDGSTLYYCAFTGRRLLAIDAARLADERFSDAEAASTIRDLGEIGIAGHLATDSHDRIYIVGIEHDAIFRRSSDGALETLVADPRLMWPDTLTLGQDGYVYITASQHDREPDFHAGVDLRRRPFGLFKVRADASPVR